MTGMLASVASLEEARIVLKQRVDIIDLKDPKLGALGALDQRIISSVVQLVNNLIPTSATIGDIKPNDIELSERIIMTANSGVSFIKVGLFDKNISENFIKIINQCGSENINIIIVLFAEDIENIDLLESLMKSNIRGIMLDTKDKSSRNLCSLLKYRTLDRFIKLAKSYNLITGLAGSLKIEDIDKLIQLKPDYLGFRGALCSNKDRVKSIDNIAVKKIRDTISRKNAINYKNITNTEVIASGSVA
jgi:uncharacterized protein (UPF0264 family)|tara:strand:+ start:5145 stop:5885 length:741 start_codon:yes stop_codon:yes gene_type:complete